MAQKQQQASTGQGGGGIGVQNAPAGAKMFELSAFDGLNTKSPRVSIGDGELAWCENLFPIGPGNLRALWGKGNTLYSATVGKIIKYAYAFNIGSTGYHFIVLSDGTAVAVNINTGGVTTITNTVNTFYAANGLPQAAQWGSKYLIIVTPAAANGYYIWDGTTLYSPGGSAPAEFGGTMPTGVSGTAIEIYNSRVIVINGSFWQMSAPSTPVDFATSSGGVTIKSTDNYLKSIFTAAKQANGFLYPFGDSSINVVSNVATSGSPATTTFSNSNTDPQIGTAWRDSVQPFGRSIVFGNNNGIYILVGGAAEKISDQLDGIFASATFTLDDTRPSAASATLFGIKCYLILLDTLDPDTGAHRKIVYLWDGKKWFQGSQQNALTYIWGQEINSILTAWGTDGTIVFSIFTLPAIGITKKVKSRLWPGSSIVVNKKALRLYTEIKDFSGNGATVSLSVDNEIASGVPVSLSGSTNLRWTGANGNTFGWTGADLNPFAWTLPGLAVAGQDVNAYGKALGLTLTSTGSDFALISSLLLYRDDQLVA